MKIDIQTIKQLRSSTGVGLTDVKKALEEAGGDYDKALDALRVKGLAKASKKATREAKAGLIHGYVHASRIGVLVELNCETDFVARTEDFKTLANDLALHIAASAPQYVDVSDVPTAAVDRERAILAAELKEQGKPEKMISNIVEGKLEKYFSEICLLKQPFVKNADQNVESLIQEAIAKLGENIIVRRFSRIALGE